MLSPNLLEADQKLATAAAATITAAQTQQLQQQKPPWMKTNLPLPFELICQ